MYLNLNTYFLTRNWIRRADQLQTESFFLFLEKDGKRRKLSNYKKRTRPWVRVCKVTFLMPYQHCLPHPIHLSAYIRRKKIAEWCLIICKNKCVCVVCSCEYVLCLPISFTLSLWKKKNEKRRKKIDCFASFCFNHLFPQIEELMRQ